MLRTARSLHRGTISTLCCLLLACALSACGGGSATTPTPPQSGDPPPDPPTEPDPPPPTDPATGTISVSWLAPTSNDDGSPLTDLAGYRIYYGLSADALDHVVEVDDPTATSHAVEGLTLQTWFFGISAFTTQQTESGYTLIASATATAH